MDGFAQQFAEFADALTEAEDFETTAEQLIGYTVKAVGAASGGITVLRGGRRFETIGATDSRVLEADAAQYTLDEGPCVEAATQARSLTSGALKTDRRWPRWGPAAHTLGFASVLSADINGRGRRIGALNLYSPNTDAFSPDDVELARVMATQSAAVLVALNSELGLREALETRTLIGQAQGMIMERFDIDADQSFAVLRRFSQSANIKLREVAAQLVQTRRMPD